MKPIRPEAARSARALVAALQNEWTLLKRILHLSGLLGDALRRSDIQRIPALEQALEQALAQEPALEKALEAAAQDLARLTGCRPGRLADLLPFVPEPDDRRLKHLQREILQLHSRIRASQEANRALVSNGLATIRMLLRIVTCSAVQPSTYGHAAAPATATLFLDQKA